MKMNYTDKESKITLYSFGFALFLSFILGLIVGNPPGIAFVRAFLASFIFAAVVFGVIIIIKKYVPELFEIKEETGEKEEAPAEESTPVSEEKMDDNSGKKVDLFVGDDYSNVKPVDRETHTSEETGALKDEVERKSETAYVDGEETKNQEENEVKKEEDLPPIEELLGEEDLPPEIQAEDEALSGARVTDSEYIEVGNVKIPNEPELLAKAIEKVMKEDESG